MRGSVYDCAPLSIQLQQTHKKIMGLKWLGERGGGGKDIIRYNYIRYIYSINLALYMYIIYIYIVIYNIQY